MPRRMHRTLTSVFLIFLLCLAVYLNSFSTSLHFDDFFAITGNAAVRDITDVGQIFRVFPGRFLLMFSFAVNYAIHGADPTGYHVANFLFHLINAVLLYFITFMLMVASRTTQDDEMFGHVPLIVALLFAIHPILTESVTYISGRTSSLAAVFFLLSLLLYMGSVMDQRGDGSREKSMFVRTFLYSGSLLVFFLSLWVKESNVTIPAILLILDFCFVEESRWNKLKNSLKRVFPFFVVVAAILLWRRMYIGAVGEPRAIRGTAENVYTQMQVIISYLRLVLIPVGQNIDHDYPLSQSLFEPKTLLSVIFLFVLALTAILRLNKNKVISFGILWWLITLAPTSSVIPLWDIMSERWIYLSSIGILLVGAAFLREVYALAPQVSFRRRLANGAVIAIILALSALTITRNSVWKTEYTLWTDAVQKSPDKARPHTNLGMALVERGDLEGAAREVETALALDPQLPEAAFSLASINLYKGKYDETIAVLNATFARFPDDSQVPVRIAHAFAKARFNLGLAYFHKGEYSRAIAEYESALRLAPYLPWTHNNLGAAYEALGEYELAIAEYEKEFALNPGFVQARQNIENIRRRLNGGSGESDD
ncbi:MAG: tetratricopeptide repeat protein [Candidatus Abyssobacteria bacterium SURF_17]|jgi:tetratricopeptide (TPR) repeat protein|uniref:Tetratricopeptide repeat protein n=1 Tax=Candidatus Abyssobacteria bacterium SURF_17 TaxID=2093361 RepID=A0A419EQU8_9BACT|nr:MAG: tetratricopeptide repeat protein [Candidatus Abyssubacteria bacterium SURF_17]